MTDQITIPEKHQAFCRAIAKVCREHKMRGGTLRYTPGFDDEWPHDISMSWTQGRHGADANKIIISSEMSVHTRIDDAPDYPG